VERIGRSADRPQDNLLTSGDFENRQEVLGHWMHSQHPLEGVRANATLTSSCHRGKWGLQLIASPVSAAPPPVVIPKPPVSVTSPAVPVRAGQVLYVSGWLNVVTPVTGSLDGVTVHDNVGGMTSALRFTEKLGWQRFQMLQDIREDTNYRVTINLNGMGEVLLDDVQIIPHRERPIQAASGRRIVPAQAQPPRRFWNPLDSFRQQELQPLDGAAQ
jgi:hypothetical protein